VMSTFGEFREPVVKSVGKPDARNGHVRFDERGRETTGCQWVPVTRPSSTLRLGLRSESRPNMVGQSRSDLYSFNDGDRYILNTPHQGPSIEGSGSVNYLIMNEFVCAITRAWSREYGGACLVELPITLRYVKSGAEQRRAWKRVTSFFKPLVTWFNR